jgi:hypothetical protein
MSSSSNNCNVVANVSIATRVDIVCWRGDTFVLTATIADVDGHAVDLSVYTWKMRYENMIMDH